MTSRPHRCEKNGRGAHGAGSHACYSLCSCRCRDCCFGRSEYERRRRKANAYGQSLMVDAEPVRAHVRDLMCDGKRGTHHQGVGLKQIVKVSGVAQGTLWKLMYGAPDRDGPSKMVRRSTAERLLAVTHDDIADGATVPAGPTRRKLEQLVNGGFARAELARYISGDIGARSLQVAKARRVTVATERAVEDLHHRWRDGAIVPRGRRSRHEAGPVSPFPATPAPDGWLRRDCIDCGGPTLAGGLRCLPCFHQAADPRSAPSVHPRCGTYSGYSRHSKAGERPCSCCRDAKTAYMTERKVPA